MAILWLLSLLAIQNPQSQWPKARISVTMNKPCRSQPHRRRNRSADGIGDVRGSPSGPVTRREILRSAPERVSSSETTRQLAVDTAPGRSSSEKHFTRPDGRCKTRASATEISRRMRRRIVTWRKAAEAAAIAGEWPETASFREI